MKEKLFKQYRRKQIAELRLVTNEDIQAFKNYANNLPTQIDGVWVSISDVDRQNESPKIGDMIARNPKNYNDQWLVAKQYFEDNFESIEVEEKQPEKQSELAMYPKQPSPKVNAEWISIKDQLPPDYERVLWFDNRDNHINLGYFVWSQTPVNYVTYWMKLPNKPIL